MLGRLGAVIALLSLAAMAAWLYVSLDRPVRHVEVVGALAPAEAAQVRRRLTELKPRRLLSTDLGALREHLLALSWPRLVHIRRVWPDTISIRIERQLVVAKWGDEGYLTAGGERVASMDRRVDVPLLECQVASPLKALEVYRYLQDIASENGLQIRSLAENAFGEWQLQLDDGVRAHLGAEALPSRMRRFMRVHRHLGEMGSASASYLDLRYANGAAVRFDEPQMLTKRCPGPTHGAALGAEADSCDNPIPRSGGLAGMRAGAAG